MMPQVALHRELMDYDTLEFLLIEWNEYGIALWKELKANDFAMELISISHMISSSRLTLFFYSDILILVKDLQTMLIGFSGLT